MKSKKLLSFILTLTMVLSLVPAFTVSAFAGSQPNVSYRYPEYNTTAQPKSGISNWKTGEIDTYTVITSEAAITSLTTGWYVVEGTVSLDEHIDVTGSVNLILTDSCDFTVNSYIDVSGTNSLTIYGQNESSGKLTVKIVKTNEDYGRAAIGGNPGNNITINGGNISATGGPAAAGIGGNKQCQANNIVINGGKVYATSPGNAPGIGGGFAAEAHDVVINGGWIEAVGSFKAPGIGGGTSRGIFGLTINDGVVIASADSTLDHAIGSGGTHSQLTMQNSSDIKVAEKLTVVAGMSPSPTKTIQHTSDEDITAKLGSNTRYIEIFYHPHNWSVSSTSNSVTSYCSNKDYRHIGNEDITLAFNPQDKEYNESPIGIELDGEDDWTNLGLTVPTVYYEGIGETVYASNVIAPTNVGTYHASASVSVPVAGGTSVCAISADYKILKNSWKVLPVVSVKDFYYGEYDDTIPANLPTNDVGIQTDITYYFNKENSNVGGTEWNKADLNKLDSGTYYVYAVLSENENMYGCTTEPTPFNIKHKHDYGYKKSGEKNSILVECVSPDKSCVGDVRKITLIIEDAVYTGKPYVPTGVTLFEKESGRKVTLTCTDANGNPLAEVPTDVGSYKAVLTIPGETYNGTSDAVTVSAPFSITQKSVVPPTAGSTTYTYTGGEQTYILTDSVDKGCYQLSGTTGKRTDAGTQDVVVELVSTTNYVWEDGTTEPITLKDAFTIGRMAIPVPYGDPRYFEENGHMQEYLALYVVGNYFYDFNGVFYNVTNNKKSNAGLTFASVTPGDNFCWADGSTRAISGWNFPFYIDKRSISASVDMLKDNRTGAKAEGYVWGYYTQSPNSSDLYVKTHYTPKLNVYTSDVKNMRVEYYVTDGRNTWNWNDLTYKTLKYYDNNAGEYYKYYYVYAKIYSSNYETFTTPYSYFFVFQPGCLVYGYKTSTYTERVKHESHAKRHVVYYENETKTKANTIYARAFIDLSEVRSVIENSINSRQCDYCLFSQYFSYSQSKFDSSNINKLSSIFGAAAIKPVKLNLASYVSQVNPDDFPAQKNSVEALVDQEFTEITLQNNVNEAVNNLVDSGNINLGERYENVGIFGNDKAVPDAPRTSINLNSTQLQALKDEGESNTVNITYDYGYYSFEDEADAYGRNFSWTVVKPLGTYLTYPGAPSAPEGYKFAGWYYFPDEVFGQGKELDISVDGVKWDFDNNIIESDITLYGSWELEASEEQPQTAVISGGGMIRTENPFSDVKESDYFYNAVVWANKYGVTRGKTPVIFDPKSTCTRAEFITFLWRAAGEPEVDYQLPFTDVKLDSFYGKALRWAASLGIVQGTTATTFAPTATINRAQAVTYIARYAGVKDDATGYTNKFSDVASGSYYTNSVAWAAENKITSGKTTDTFGPADNCQRAHVVVFLYNYFNK